MLPNHEYHSGSDDAPAVSSPVTRKWYCGGQLHRTGGKPAQIKFSHGRTYHHWFWRGEYGHGRPTGRPTICVYADSNATQLVIEMWKTTHGFWRAGDKPHKITYNTDGTRLEAAWLNPDGSHYTRTTGGAARILYDQGVVRKREWLRDDYAYNHLGGPTEIFYDARGVMFEARWKKKHINDEVARFDDKHFYSRDNDLPSRILFHPDGVTIKEEYYIRNELHERNDDKPTKVVYPLRAPLHQLQPLSRHAPTNAPRG